MASTTKPLAVRIALGFIAVAIAVAVWHAVAPFHGGAETAIEVWVLTAAQVTAAVLCAARAFAVPAQRAINGALAIGIGGWIVGDLYWELFMAGQDNPPTPSWSDAGYLTMYPALCVAVALHLREQRVRLSKLFAVDAVIGALGIGAVSAAVVIEAVVSSGDAGPTGVAVLAIAYPIGDILVLATVLATLVLSGWRVDGALARLVVGLTIVGVANSVYVLQVVHGTYATGAILDVSWPVASVFFALSAWHGSQKQPADPREGAMRLSVTPAAFALVSLAMLVYAYLGRLNPLTVTLAGLSLVFVVVRMVLTIRENLVLLTETRREALTDPLTDLGNRRRLLADLEACGGDRSARTALVLLDLNGFKSYNDSFGHPAGDALLERLGGRLNEFAAGVGGRAYRLGGDEFCVVMPLAARSSGAVASAAADALRERGDGFAISAAHGSVVLPDEAQSGGDALAIADRRMYELKRARRRMPGRDAGDVLSQLLMEYDAEVGSHAHDVGELARATAKRMGLAPVEVERVALAGELHDVGKTAIPNAILDKVGPLDEEEWQIVRRHTLIGERILARAPTLTPVAPLVRSSQERWDGGGYPDGLSGEAIPLGARIVFVCDAFESMVADRVYSTALSPWDAVAELRRCAGTQFDPDVVTALSAVVGAQMGPSPRALAA
jgi:two-component system cell cycle response regulator